MVRRFWLFGGLAAIAIPVLPIAVLGAVRAMWQVPEGNDIGRG